MTFNFLRDVFSLKVDFLKEQINLSSSNLGSDCLFERFGVWTLVVRMFAWRNVTCCELNLPNYHHQLSFERPLRILPSERSSSSCLMLLNDRYSNDDSASSQLCGSPSPPSLRKDSLSSHKWWPLRWIQGSTKYSEQEYRLKKPKRTKLSCLTDDNKWN